MKYKHKTAGILFAAFVTAFGAWGCTAEKPAAQSEEDVGSSMAPVVSGSDEAFSEEETTEAPENAFTGIPELPGTGEKLSDFIPAGWTLLDSVTLDFNEDGAQDYVGVLDYIPDSESEAGQEQFWTRILFAVRSEGPGRYYLDFQDENLIRARSEGGVFGDPYEPLTAEGRSFTTNSFGGSAWKWSEAYTYTYDNGTWYQTASETTYGYGPYTTDYSKDDYVSGIGTRYRRSSEFEDMQENMEDQEWIGESCDLSYEVSLDEPLTIAQAGMRWWLSPKRAAEWPVDSVEIADGVDISQDFAEELREIGDRMFSYNDENYLLFSVRDRDGENDYLAQYDRKDRTLAVLAQEGGGIDSIILYRGRIYYTCELHETVNCRDNEGSVVQSKEQVGMALYSMNQDGTDRREVFAYRLPESGEEVIEQSLPYISFTPEISGGEIILEVYIGDRPHPFYRMDLNGGGAEMIGTLP